MLIVFVRVSHTTIDKRGFRTKIIKFDYLKTRCSLQQYPMLNRRHHPHHGFFILDLSLPAMLSGLGLVEEASGFPVLKLPLF